MSDSGLKIESLNIFTRQNLNVQEKDCFVYVKFLSNPSLKECSTGTSSQHLPLIMKVERISPTEKVSLSSTNIPNNNHSHKYSKDNLTRKTSQNYLTVKVRRHYL